MISVVYGPQEVLKAFAEQGIFEGQAVLDACQCIGIVKDQKLVSVMAYHNWDQVHGIIELSGYSTCRNWATKAVVDEIFSYPFHNPGVRVLIGRHSKRNRRVRKIWRSLGAKEYTIPELWGANEAMCISVLSKEAWDTYRDRLGRNEQTQGTNSSVSD